MVKKPPVRDHIEVSMDALKAITAWLDKNLLPPPVESISVEEFTDEGPAAVKPDGNI